MASHPRVSLKKPRSIAFTQQNGLCFYCHEPMWLDNPERFAQKFKLSHRQAGFFQCTGEHLVAHCHGGSSNTHNIVAACRYCNMQRHARKEELSPEKFEALVSKRKKKQRWLPFRIHAFA